ncbi:MAG: complex I subunit 5 family protein [Eubacteriales bacterium]
MMITMIGNEIFIPDICGMGLHFEWNGFNTIQTILAIFMWIVAIVFSKEYMKNSKHKTRYYVFLILTLVATIGVFLSSNLYTTFIFFEIMSITSYVWVVQEETKAAIKASNTYLTVAVLGGLVMLMGLFILYKQTGTLEIDQLLDKCYAMKDKTWLYIASLCMLFGFGAKAGIFGLHIWMGDSYTESPAPTSALLSSVLSKTGILGIIIITANIFYHDVTWGRIILIIGVLTMVLGAVLALTTINVKYTLAYSSMSQIGFILVGIGMSGLLGDENTIAIRGSVLHMMNHSFIKLILFTIAGIIFMNVGKLDLNEIRGYGKKKPFLKYSFLVAALGIAGVPFFNGYISKTLLHESIVEAIHLSIYNTGYLETIEWLFLISGGFTLAYMTKLYIAIFVETNVDEQVQENFDADTHYVSNIMKVILASCAGFLVAVGCFPHLIADQVADISQGIMYPEGLAHEIEYFAWENLKGAGISLMIGCIAYALVVRMYMVQGKGEEQKYISAWPKWLNVEKLVYHPTLFTILPMVMGIICRILDSIVDSIVVGLRKTIMKDEKLPAELEEGTVVTYTLGSLVNAICDIHEKVNPNKNKRKTDFIHLFAVKSMELRENHTIIMRSMSFGLVLFCLGLSVTLIYMLF